ncbi:hypothetical protein ACFPOI_10945 [Nonomuraea angiospora]|uniref:LPXTG cell wall anchor domain-containing protein n=1 Tax=Nonomuraea angiospora TaxID=46172 RepID=A0ABR9MAQ9_9ACTN|nr:hypothetical protein [Nonomuraea angiospora]MBE1589889.1 hypothetical protein [Nonomuraea angiospora]
MSQAWRRLAHKTSALGLVSTLVLFVGSVLALSSPAQAAAVDPLKVTYKCTGGYLAAESVQVTVTAPTSVEPSKAASIKWTFPPITATKAIAAQASVTTSGGDLTVTGGTPTPLKGSGSGTVTTAVTTGQTYTPPEMTGSVNVTATTGGNLVLAPVTTASTTVLTITVAGEATTCTYVSATPTSISVPVQTGGGGGGTDDVVEYDCDVASGGGDADYPADVDIKVTMTPPTSATANADASITWAGVIQSTGQTLKAPTGFPTTSPKMFVTVKATGAGAPATATGEATLGTVTIGQAITLPTSVTVKIKPTTTGTVTLTAGDLAFGTSASSPAIKCLAPTTGLKTYTFQVGSSTGTPTTSPTPTNTTSSPKPTKTSTATVTVTPSTKKSKTPKAGADTGGGGEAGPDGRMFILTGTALVGAAAVGGLVMRRRNATRG